jgi:hypothetical protein
MESAHHVRPPSFAGSHVLGALMLGLLAAACTTPSYEREKRAASADGGLPEAPLADAAQASSARDAQLPQVDSGGATAREALGPCVIGSSSLADCALLPAR